MLKLSRSAQTTLALVVAAVVLIGIAVMVVSFNKGVDDDLAAAEKDSANYRPETAEEKRSKETHVTVLGDSFAGGSDMNEGPTWPEQLAAQNGWMLDNEAVGGSGYLEQADLGPALPGRLDKIPRKYADLVIFAVGINDSELDLKKVIATAEKTIADVQAITPGSDFVILSPFCNGTNHLRPAITNLRDALAKVAADAGIPYIDVTEYLPPNAIGSDGTHPTDEGHAILTEKIGAALKALGLPKADAWKAA